MGLDEANAAYLKRVLESGMPRMEDLTLRAYRDSVAEAMRLAPPGPELARVEDHALFRADVTIPIRVYAADDAPRAIVLYLHGGGWAVGGIDGWDPLMRLLTKRTRCWFVSVGYRLAPEHPFPAAVEDTMSAIDWVISDLRERAGADVPVGIAGDSAGANLAAVAALLVHDRKAHGMAGLAFQILAYPVVDVNAALPSLHDFDPPRLTVADLERYFDAYAPDRVQPTDFRLSPIHAESHAGLPPAFVLTADNDILRGQGEAYAAKLVEAGVPVCARRYIGTMHGFLGLGSAVPQSSWAVNDIDAFIGWALKLD